MGVGDVRGERCLYNADKVCNHCNDRCKGNDQRISQAQQDYEDWKSSQ